MCRKRIPYGASLTTHSTLLILEPVQKLPVDWYGLLDFDPRSRFMILGQVDPKDRAGGSNN